MIFHSYGPSSWGAVVLSPQKVVQEVMMKNRITELSHLVKTTPYFKYSTGQLCHMLQNLQDAALDISPGLPKGNFSYGPRMLLSSVPSSCLQRDIMLLLLLLYFLSLRYYSKIFSHFLLDFILQFASLFSYVFIQDISAIKRCLR